MTPAASLLRRRLTQSRARAGSRRETCADRRADDSIRDFIDRRVARPRSGARLTDWRQLSVWSIGFRSAAQDHVACEEALVLTSSPLRYANAASWGGIVIQHKYRGITYFSQYGHVRAIRVNVGAFVARGQQIAEIGSVGANSPHLHFEIREFDYPNPTLGSFFTCGHSLLSVQQWYENPVPFTKTHTAYSHGTPYVWRFSEDQYFEEWDAINIVSASVHGGILFIDPHASDPHIVSGPLAAVAYTFPYVQFRIASNAPDNRGAIYFKTRVEDFYSEDKKLMFNTLNCPPNICNGNAPFQYYNIYVGGHPKWTNTITGLRIDPAENGWPFAAARSVLDAADDPA
jgi:Peptidase family M23